jgi:Ribbon-helix-helix protein, copG family
LKKATHKVRWGGKRKGAGRPAIGKAPTYSFRLPPELVVELDAWAKSHGITRGEAVRRLVEFGLKK